jgi:hypothetical protein
MHMAAFGTAVKASPFWAVPGRPGWFSLPSMHRTLVSQENQILAPALLIAERFCGASDQLEPPEGAVLTSAEQAGENL